MKRVLLPVSMGIVLVLIVTLAALRRPKMEAETKPNVPESRAAETDVEAEVLEAVPEIAPTTQRDVGERTALPHNPSAVVEDEGTRVRMTVRATRSTKSAVVPGVRVVVGVGKGIVKWRGFPLEEMRFLGEGRSDDEGALDVLIEIPGIDAKDNALEGYTLFAHVDQPGYQRILSGHALPDGTNSTPIELHVTAQRGVTLFGQVLRASGDPASHGRVRVFREKEDGKTDYSKNVKVSISKDGRFMANLPEAGRWHVHARSKNLGAFGIRDFEVVDGVSEKLLLQLEGPGVLAGRVVDLAGQPIPAYKLWAVPGDRPDDYVGYYHDPVCLPHEWSGGTFDGHTTTNEAGEFRFAGLQEGTYFIRGTQATSGYYDAKLTLTPVATGQTDLELSLPRHCVLLTVRDESGKPIRAQKMNYPKWDPLLVPNFYVKKCDGQGRVSQPYRPDEGRVGWLESGQHAVEVLPDESYIVGLFGPQHSLQETEVRVPFGEFRVPVEFDLPPRAEPGTLRIEVQNPVGEPLTSNTDVEIRSPSGLVLFRSGRMSFSSTHKLKLPPGIYRCRVSDIVGRGHHGERIGRQEHSAVFVEAHVESGRELFLPVRLAGAGRVKVLARLDAGRGEPVPEDLGVELLFYPEAGGEALQVEFDRGSDHMFQSTTTWVRANTAETCLDPIPAGKYVAHLKSEGFSTAKVPLLIEAGRTVELHATLVRDGK